MASHWALLGEMISYARATSLASSGRRTWLHSRRPPRGLRYVLGLDFYPRDRRRQSRRAPASKVAVSPFP